MIDKKGFSYSIVIKVLLWILVIGVGILLYMYWNNIPSIVGIHINLAGEIDNFGDKTMLVIAWLVTVAVNLLYTFNYQFNYTYKTDGLYKRFPFLYHMMATIGIFAISIFIVARVLGK